MLLRWLRCRRCIACRCRRARRPTRQMSAAQTGQNDGMRRRSGFGRREGAAGAAWPSQRGAASGQFSQDALAFLTALQDQSSSSSSTASAAATAASGDSSVARWSTALQNLTIGAGERVSSTGSVAPAHRARPRGEPAWRRTPARCSRRWTQLGQALNSLGRRNGPGGPGGMHHHHHHHGGGGGVARSGVEHVPAVPTSAGQSEQS